MTKLTKKLMTTVAFVMCTAPVWAEDQPNAADIDRVVATVNGTEITMGHMMLVYDSLPDQYKSLGADQLYEGILDQLVQQTILEQKFGADTRRVTLAIENDRRLMKAGAVIDEVAQAAATEEEVAKAYAAQYGNFEGGDEYNASHILVETEEAAKDLIAKLQGGADFAALAQEHSTGPSGPNGGSLGWFGKGMMVPEFEAAVGTLEKGGFSSEPVKTQFGWHVIILNDIRKQAAPTLDEVRAELVDGLQRQAVEAFVSGLEDTAKIIKTPLDQIDPNLVTKPQLIGQ
jgi:peptidyl-prolyl cis-trans isomerase C